MITGANFLESAPMLFFAVLLWAVGVWRVLRWAGRRRWHQRPAEFVARKVEENDRVILENRIRRHPDFLRVCGDDDSAPAGTLIFDHVEPDLGWEGAHPLGSSGCPRCAELIGSLRAG